MPSNPFLKCYMPAVLVLTVLAVICTGIVYDRYVQTPSSMYADKSSSEDQMAGVLPLAPDFNFTDIHGAVHALGDLKGKVVLLNFWATWCAPCTIELPKLVKLTTGYNGKVVLIALSSDTENPAIIRFLETQNDVVKSQLKLPSIYVARDDGQKITRDIFMTTKYPETILITPDQKMARKVVGDTAWNGVEMRSYLDKLTASVH